MPLVKAFDDPRDGPPIKIWRYWCSCLYPTHVLELVEHGEDMEIGICVEPKGGFWCRVKVAWKILLGRSNRFTEVVLDKEAREELAAVIKGEIVQ